MQLVHKLSSAGMEPGVSMPASDASSDQMNSVSEVAPPAALVGSAAGGADSAAGGGEKPRRTGHVTMQLTAEVIAEISAAGAELSEEEKEPPVLYGYLYKKSPELFRLKAFDWRFFVICDGKLIWWKNMESCVAPSAGRPRASTDDIMAESTEAENHPRVKGMINLNISEAEVKEDLDSSTVFSLSPANFWDAGATTDKNKDEKRVYIFDATDSAHSREIWVDVLRKHIEKARRKKAARKSTAKSEAKSEYWEDDTIDEEQQIYHAKLVEKLETRRRMGIR